MQLHEPPDRTSPSTRAAARRRRALALLLLFAALPEAQSLAQPPAHRKATQGKVKQPGKPQDKTRPSAPSPAAGPSAAAARVEFPPPDLSKPPPMLPVASRERMRACADEWSKLKMESKEQPPLWRDFASKCLTR